jgi:hypothetical protein
MRLPAKKSIQIDVSTTAPLTGHIEADVESELPAQSHRIVVRTTGTHQSKTLDESFGDPLSGHGHRLVENIFREVRGYFSQLGGHATNPASPVSRVQ